MKPEKLLELLKQQLPTNKSLKSISLERFVELGQQGPDLYRSFSIKKKSGSSRLVEEPVEDLKIIQQAIIKLIEPLLVTPTLYGVTKRGASNNAACHTDARVVLNIDLQDFFPNTDETKYYFALEGIDNELADILLSCLRYVFIVDTKRNVVRLPTGAPSSPAIANLCFLSADRELLTLSDQYNLTYTRYVDDLTFSGESIPYEFKLKVYQTIRDYNYPINYKKTKKSYRGRDSQQVTGVLVSSNEYQINCTREYRRGIRVELDKYARSNRELDPTMIGKLIYIKQLNKQSYNNIINYYNKRVNYWKETNGR